MTKTKQQPTPETTPVFVHVYGEIRDVNGNLENGNGNVAVLCGEVTATIHRTLSDAEKFRAKTSGFIIPTTADKLAVLFPPGSVRFPELPTDAFLVSPKQLQGDLKDSIRQKHHHADVVAPYIMAKDKTAARAKTRADNEWLEQLHKIIPIRI